MLAKLSYCVDKALSYDTLLIQDGTGMIGIGRANTLQHIVQSVISIPLSSKGEFP
jgi:hypothetical protein